ncbi:hypothetical protein TRFO_04569 [Tritrichomonas foetus]|uniref:Myb-like DNA-binding domain containing protein n=1 Tax=Tritrichomonas foetus TaxID=1144522 RepID=A0A1J4KEP2_9EUKA|nr:hypothetical protein TRFO_04569 [Tritrichomonas foetus]|eukprot:OHT09482.1 hypothetical protein TRFO_04569 [Tritrichomonas foetus]
MNAGSPAYINPINDNTNHNYPDTHTSHSKILSSGKRKGGAKKKFTPEEDKILKEVVRDISTNNWNAVAQELPGRNGRQCRERWNNYVNPKFKKGSFTPEEDDLLDKKYAELGPRWHLIASFFPNRSCNIIKNRFFTRERRQNKIKNAEVKIDNTTKPSNDSFQAENIVKINKNEFPHELNYLPEEPSVITKSEYGIQQVKNEFFKQESSPEEPEIHEENQSAEDAFNFLDRLVPKNDILFSSNGGEMDFLLEMFF